MSLCSHFDTFDASYMIYERVVGCVPMHTLTKGPNTFYNHDVILHLTASQCLIKHKLSGALFHLGSLY